MPTSTKDAVPDAYKDDERLRELGYTPALQRCWSAFAALALVLSSMSVLTSIIGELNLYSD